jgi:hypothetical protein
MMTQTLKRPDEDDPTTRSDDSSRRRFLKVSSMLGLAVAFSPRTIVETFAHSKAGITKKENIVTQTTATGTEQAADKTAIRPFQLHRCRTCRFAPARQRDQVARARIGTRCVPGRSACDDAETRTLLGNRL